MRYRPKKQTVETTPYDALEELYQVLFEQSADGIFIADRGGRCIEVNRRGCEMLGYTREEILKFSLQELIPAEELAADPLRLDELRAGKTILKERRLRCKDGHLLPVEIDARMLADGTFLGVVRDISERKRAEESVQESEGRYRSIFDNVLDGLYLVEVTEDDRFRNIEINPALERMTGIPRALVIGKTQEECGPEETARKVNNKFRHCIEAGRPIEEEVELDLPSGRRIFHSTLLPIRDKTGRIHRILGISGDITEVRQAEQELQRSNDLLRAVIEAAPTAIIGLDLDGNVQMVWNPTAEKMLGWSAQEALSRPLPSVPAERHEEFRRFREMIRNGLTLDGVEVRWQRRDGSPIDYSIYASPLHDAEGRIAGNIAVLVDITERKRAEEELRRNREAALQFSEQLATLQDVTNQLSKAESFDDLCRQAVQLGRSHLGFDRVGIWFIEERAGIMLGSFGTDERGELRDERNARVEFKPEGLAWHVFSRKEPMACVEHCPLRDHRGREVGEGDNAVAALWDGDEVIGVICVDNLFSHQPITERQLEILRFYATTLGHLITRKRTEEALRKSAERLRLAAHASNVGLWDWDLQTNRVVFSCEWKSQLGYEEHEIGADYSEWERRLHPDDLAPTLAALRACLDGSHPEYAVEFRLRHKDGSYRWIYARGEVFHDVRGKPVRMLGCHVDITERKQAEEAQQKRGWFRNRLTH